MKVLYICGDFSVIGGIEKYNKDFIDSLKMTNTDIRTVLRFPGGLFAKISFVLRVILTVILYRPNFILCGHLHFGSLCLAFKKLFNIPYLINLYGIEIISLCSNRQKQIVNEAYKVITISEYSKRLILEKFPTIEPKLFMHPSSVDGEKYNIRTRNQYLIEKFQLQNRPVILSLARLSTPEHKGQDRVLKALPQVLATFPEAVYLIVGSGVDQRVTDFLTAHTELKNNVILAGAAKEEEKPDFYNLADIYILPSKFEGFGIVFIESLSCGIPVIASDGYGCRESLLNGEIGTLVPPDDIEYIAMALIKALKDKEENQKITYRQNLREKTLQIYGIDAWHHRTKKLVNELYLLKIK